MANGVVGIIVSLEGVETLSFLGSTEEERRIGFELYKSLEEELRMLDGAIKRKFQIRKGSVKRGSHL
jgi:hypothetical protein